ncbi:hypothetical protein MHB40_02100 [Lysinibacillus sp. FSL K6-0057]|uniref:hypothetical protein n=1 Tax=Lysinibacillus sp. FSL K6-0057 TaxID=2921411 RepID=UPI003159E7CA
MKKVKTLCRMVDWSGASVTPRGFSVTEETLERTEVSEAAHRTPPGKDAGGTEINPSYLVKKSFSTSDNIFFNNMKSPMNFVIHWTFLIILLLMYLMA